MRNRYSRLFSSLVKIAFAPICACKNNWGSQKRPSLAVMAKWAIDDCFSGIVCSGHKIACKKWINTFVAVNNDFGHSWGDLPLTFTRDQKIVVYVTHALFYISTHHALIKMSSVNEMLLKGVNKGANLASAFRVYCMSFSHCMWPTTIRT